MYKEINDGHLIMRDQIELDLAELSLKAVL